MCHLIQLLLPVLVIIQVNKFHSIVSVTHVQAVEVGVGENVLVQ